MQRFRPFLVLGRRFATEGVPPKPPAITPAASNASQSHLPPSQPNKGWGSGKGPISWKTAGITFTIGGGLLGFISWLKSRKREAIDKERQRAIGKISLGGEFELVDSGGKIRKSTDFLGQWILLYFGFTHCPDICPDELEKMSEVIEKLDKMPEAPKIQPIFISVDPARDSPEIVGKYCKEFSPKLLGLTGTDEQVQKACKAYRVYYSSGPKDVDADYIVDHTIIMYLVDPKGQFQDYYGQTKNSEDITNSILYNIAKFNQINKTGWFSSVLPA